MADRATLSTVAARAGVSSSTASLAFAGSSRVAPATVERVLRAADELGYAGPNPVAASLRTGRSGVVGAVVGERLLYAFRDPVAVQLLDGLTEELGKLDVGLLLLALAGVAALVVPSSPAHKKVRLGLDLQGGLEVVLKAVPPKNQAITADGMDTSVSRMRDRSDDDGDGAVV